MPFTLVIGGARSGKSSFALELAGRRRGKKAFIATMEPKDDETRERVRLHQNERGPEWETFEEEKDLAPLITGLAGYDIILIDCLTLWLSNVILSDMDARTETEGLLEAVKQCGNEIVAVTNEVGMGIVPENALARRFRDEAGRLNRMAAASADSVYAVFAGIPIRIKGERG